LELSDLGRSLQNIGNATQSQDFGDPTTPAASGQCGLWPSSLDDLTTTGFTSTEGVSVWYFITLPEFSRRPASVLLILAHDGSATMLYTVYPISNGEVIEISSSTPACGF
jgi:hypothetical protein